MADLDDVDRHAKEIIAKVRPRFETLAAAEAWYGAVALPGFSGQTACQLVATGRAKAVVDYIDAVDAGVQA